MGFLYIDDYLQVLYRWRTLGPSILYKSFVDSIPFRGLPLLYWQQNPFCNPLVDGRASIDVLSIGDLLRASVDRRLLTGPLWMEGWRPSVGLL